MDIRLRIIPLIQWYLLDIVVEMAIVMAMVLVMVMLPVNLHSARTQVLPFVDSPQ